MAGQFEKVSRSQAQNLGKRYNEIINSASQRIRTSCEEFVKVANENWADDNEFKFITDFSTDMTNISDVLSKNSKSFLETIERIANSYIATGGGSGRVSLDKPKADTHNYQGKKIFDGTTDETGFKTTTSPDTILEAFNKLVGELETIASDVTSSLKSIDAFGNTTVKNNIAVSGGKVVEILREGIEKLSKDLNAGITAALEAYEQTGKKAAEAANLQAGE